MASRETLIANGDGEGENNMERSLQDIENFANSVSLEHDGTALTVNRGFRQETTYGRPRQLAVFTGHIAARHALPKRVN